MVRRRLARMVGPHAAVASTRPLPIPLLLQGIRSRPKRARQAALLVLGGRRPGADERPPGGLRSVQDRPDPLAIDPLRAPRELRLAHSLLAQHCCGPAELALVRVLCGRGYVLGRVLDSS
jgi:hypothetical protein